MALRSTQTSVRSGSAASGRQGNRRTRIVPTAGQTIYSLAQEYLGDTNLWRELATFNGIDILEEVLVEGELIIPNQQDLRDMAKAFARSSITDLSRNFLNSETAQTINQAVNTVSTIAGVAARLQTVIDGEPNQALLDLSNLKQISSGDLDSLIDWIIP